MSNQDSFVDEVTDAVRRDQLFGAFRKYGWIGLVVVVGIVGGAAYNEWTKATERTRSEAFGDGALAALQLPTAAEQRTALAAVPADQAQIAVQSLLMAGSDTADKPAVLAALDALAANASQPQIYRDLAVLRRVGLAGADQPLADRRAALQSIAIPGRAFRTMAAEQLTYLLLEEGKAPEALAAMIELYQDQEAPGGLKRRLAQMITALGGMVPASAPDPAAAAPADQG